MSGVIFRETFRRGLRGMVLLGAAFAAMGLYIILILNDPSMVEVFQVKMSAMKPIVDLLGGGDASFMTTPEGMLNVSYFSWMILMLSGYAIWAGMAVTSAEEDRGIMDSLISVPVQRWRVVAEKLLAYALAMTIAVLMGWVGLVLPLGTSKIFGGVSVGRLLESSLNMLPTALMVMTFAAWIAVVVRRRNTAMMISIGFVVFSYFIDFVGRSAPEVQGLRSVSVYAYYDSAYVAQYGLAWGNIAILAAIIGVFVAGAVWLFQRRDVGV